MARTLAFLFASSLMIGQQHVWVDTDPGRFSDDNVAVVMLVRSPEKVRIDGISIVSGNVWAKEGVDNMRATLSLLNKKILVRLGAQTPLVHTAGMSKQEGPLEFAGAFQMPQPERERRSETAGEGLMQAMERSNGDLTVLAIGPLTNLAQILIRRPYLAQKIQQIVIMGGNVHVPGNSSRAAEFNFWFDPEAASVVLNSAIPKKILFALDICNTAPVTRAVFDRVAAAKTPITELYRDSFGNDYPGFLKDPKALGYLWDELPAAYLLDPGFVTKSETKYLDVVTEFGPRYGATVEVNPDRLRRGATPVDVMLALDLDRVIALYERLLKL
jgi:inosine-uridine nucleoside N-ribohydrolase